MQDDYLCYNDTKRDSTVATPDLNQNSAIKNVKKICKNKNITINRNI